MEEEVDSEETKSLEKYMGGREDENEEDDSEEDEPERDYRSRMSSVCMIQKKRV